MHRQLFTNSQAEIPSGNSCQIITSGPTPSPFLYLDKTTTTTSLKRHHFLNITGYLQNDPNLIYIYQQQQQKIFYPLTLVHSCWCFTSYDSFLQYCVQHVKYTFTGKSCVCVCVWGGGGGGCSYFFDLARC